jgi:hypothetical protein
MVKSTDTVLLHSDFIYLVVVVVVVLVARLYHRVGGGAGHVVGVSFRE